MHTKKAALIRIQLMRIKDAGIEPTLKILHQIIFPNIYPLKFKLKSVLFTPINSIET